MYAYISHMVFFLQILRLKPYMNILYNACFVSRKPYLVFNDTNNVSLRYKFSLSSLRKQTFLTYPIYELTRSALFHKLWTTENKMVGGWRKFHNEGLHNLYSSTNKIRMIMPRRMGGQGI
jgi:hypothetical protein